jgi:hypothetical protein
MKSLLLAESEHTNREKVIVRDIRVKTPKLSDAHNYRFEFYAEGFLQNCETWTESSRLPCVFPRPYSQINAQICLMIAHLSDI